MYPLLILPSPPPPPPTPLVEPGFPMYDVPHCADEERKTRHKQNTFHSSGRWRRSSAAGRWEKGGGDSPRREGRQGGAVFSTVQFQVVV